MPTLRRKRPANVLQWDRSTAYKDTCGREGLAWVTKCGLLRVTDAGPLSAPYNVEKRDGQQWRAAFTAVDAGDFKTLNTAKRAARTVTL